MTRSFRRVAVIGGDGVLGVHMLKLLLDQADIDRVVSIGRNQRKPPVYSLGIGDGDLRFVYYQAHMVHENDILMCILDQEEPDCVINFAALAHATSSVDSYRYYDTNVVALARLTEAIRELPYFKHWMQIGSSEVHGPAVDGPCSETSPANPTSPYAVSKLAGDMHLVTYFKSIDVPMNIIRPSNAYGTGQHLYRLMPRAAFCALTGQTFPLEGGGVAEKSFIHATDLAAAAGVDFDSFVALAPGRATEDSRYWLDSSKIHDELGWRPQVSLETGVAEMVAWARAHLDSLKVQTQQFSLRS